VDDVLGLKTKVYFFIGGQDQLGSDEVVDSVGVGWVETQGVTFAGGDQPGRCGAEGGVGARVSEVPGELDSCDLNLERGGIGPREAGGCPQALGLHGEGGEDESECGKRKVFDSPEFFGFRGASTKKPYEKEEMRKAQEGEGYPQIEDEVLIQCCAVRAGIDRKPPWKRDRRLMEDREHSSG
jgi:hypothetical protein